jgi:hypothetical protein
VLGQQLDVEQVFCSPEATLVLDQCLSTDERDANVVALGGLDTPRPGVGKRHAGN